MEAVNIYISQVWFFFRGYNFIIIPVIQNCIITLNKQPVPLIFFLIRSTTKDLLILGLADYVFSNIINFGARKSRRILIVSPDDLVYTICKHLRPVARFFYTSVGNKLNYLKWSFCPTVTSFSIFGLSAGLIVYSIRQFRILST